MGDLLRFDAERLRILVERHQLYTGSARARDLLDNWDAALTKFVKVMPKDYRRALARHEGGARRRQGRRGGMSLPMGDRRHGQADRLPRNRAARPRL